MQAGPLDPARVLEVICQPPSAVGAAHDAGLVHHDIEPDSLLLAPGAP
jgi:serine/threonine protein kinase